MRQMTGGGELRAWLMHGGKKRISPNNRSTVPRIFLRLQCTLNIIASKWGFFDGIEEKGPHYNFLKLHLIKSMGRQGHDDETEGFFDGVTLSDKNRHFTAKFPCPLR
jgi:hypothetical protein